MATRCCRSLSIWVKQVGLLQGWGGKVFHKIKNVCTWNLAPPTPQAAALDMENILGSCGLCMRGAGTEAREWYPRCMCRWGQGPWGILLHWGVAVALYLFTKLLHKTGTVHHCAPVMPIGEHFLISSPLSGHHCLDHKQQMTSLNLPTGDSRALQTRLTRIKDSLTKNCI